jgi:CTP:molybdopterin cytidylyltransferase MocA
MNLQHKHAGVILAAGASSRMGRPKALLEMPDGTPLAAHQANLLRAAGASEVFVIVGAAAQDIAPQLAPQGVNAVVNNAWETGRLSSLQTGLRAVPEDCCGAVVMSVDTAGVNVETIRSLLHAADNGHVDAIRLTFQKNPGKIVWLHRRIFNDLLAVPSVPDFRLDHWLREREVLLPVDDPAILNNINTPEEWREFTALMLL